MNEEQSDLISLGRVARALGITVENLRALEKRGRLPEGCEPEIDLITGSRGWTPEQVERLKLWNDERLGRVGGEPTTEDTESIEPQ